MKICFKQPREVIDMMRHGISTEHFNAKVTWPYGFDSEPIVNCFIEEIDPETGEIVGEDRLDEPRTAKTEKIENGMSSGSSSERRSI